MRDGFPPLDAIVVAGPQRSIRYTYTYCWCYFTLAPPMSTFCWVSLPFFGARRRSAFTPLGLATLWETLMARSSRLSDKISERSEDLVSFIEDCVQQYFHVELA